jgi:hypothetical protein
MNRHTYNHYNVIAHELLGVFSYTLISGSKRRRHFCGCNGQNFRPPGNVSGLRVPKPLDAAVHVTGEHGAITKSFIHSASPSLIFVVFAVIVYLEKPLQLASFEAQLFSTSYIHKK